MRRVEFQCGRVSQLNFRTGRHANVIQLVSAARHQLLRVHSMWPTACGSVCTINRREEVIAQHRTAGNALFLQQGTEIRICAYDAEKTDIQPEATALPGRSTSGQATGFVRAYGECTV